MKYTRSRLARAAFLTVAAVVSAWLLPGRWDARVAAAADAGKPAVQEAPGTRPPVVLENEMLRISVDPERGAVLGITNRKTGKQYMTQGRDTKPPFILDTYSANQAIYIRDPFELKTDLGKHEFPQPGPAMLHEFDSRHTQLTARTDQGKLALQVPALTGEVAVIVVRLADRH